MTVAVDSPLTFEDLLIGQNHVFTVRSALTFMSRAAVRWQIASGRARCASPSVNPLLAAGVQQRLVRVGQLERVVTQNKRLRRRRLIASTLDDIAGGAQALSELDFTRLVVRAYRLPEPDRQRRRGNRHGAGHRRAA